MKVKMAILMFVLSLFSVSGMAQINIFDKMEKTKDVQTIHVSKSLISMISEMDTKNADFSLLADKLKQIDVYSSKSNEAVVAMKAQSEVFAKDSSYETFMSLKEKSQNVVFYGKKNGENFKELVMIIDASDNFQVVRLLGDFTAKDIQAVIKK